MRSVQAITSPGVGGRELFTPTLAAELAAHGHPAWVLCGKGTLVEARSREWGLATFVTGLHGYFDPLALGAVAKFLRRERIQVVHAHWSKDLCNLLLAAGLAGRLPVVLTKHVVATEPKRDPFHDRLYRSVSAVIAVSRVVAENLAATTAVPAERIVTVYPGVDTSGRWDPDRLPAADLRAEFGVPAGAPLLGFVGRLNEGKGPQRLLGAFRSLAADFPDCHVVLVGRAVGESEERFAAVLRARVRDDGLAGRVHFVPYRADMPAVMRTLDVLVCPSVFESFGLVAVEAMAMERPVVATAAGGFKEIVVPGETGELFALDSEAELAAKLTLLLADPERGRRLGLAGRRRACERFSWEATLPQILAVYARVL